jgi:hypothetical protein
MPIFGRGRGCFFFFFVPEVVFFLLLAFLFVVFVSPLVWEAVS